MTDWNAFCSAATSLPTAYSDTGVKHCLVYLDPQVLDKLSLKDRLLMRTGATSSKWGRDACFAPLFEHILKSNPNLFINAPPEAVQAYNALVDFLFTDKTAQALTIESTARPMQSKTPSNGKVPFEQQKAQFLLKANLFTDLADLAKVATGPEELKAQETAFEARQSKLVLLKAKRQKLGLVIQNLPKTPPAYIEPPDEQWQKHIDVVAPFYEPQSGNGRIFADEATFNAWASQEEAYLQQVLQSASILATAKTIESQLKSFKEQLKTAPDFLYKAHVATVGALVEQKILAGVDETQIQEFFRVQKERITEVELVQKQEAENVKVQSSPYLQKLFSGDLLGFTDLPGEVSRILSQSFMPTAIDVPELTEAVVAQYKDEAKTFYAGLLSQMAALVEVATARVQKLDEMSKYARIFFTLTAPAKHFKDLETDYQLLEKNLQSLAIPKQEFVKDAFELNEKNLQEHYNRYLELKANMPKVIDGLLHAAEESEQRSEDDKSAIKRRLFEIFWNISPYLDLMENFQDMRKQLTDQLQDSLRKFYSGELSSKELLSICQEMPYEHDVVKLRNEITHRSARLKDLRDEILRLLCEVQETRRYLEIASLTNIKIYQEIQGCQAAILTLLADVENPFSAFAKAQTKDDINYVFRKFWMRIEEVQPQVERLLLDATGYLEKAAGSLKVAFIRAVDTLEEAVSLQAGSRPQLVTKVEQELQHAAQNELYNLLVSQIHAVEKKYGFSKAFSFFMAVADHKTRLSMLQEASVLDVRIQETIDFAKAMQYVKTFEEERVDIILEAFERQHIVVDASNTQTDFQGALRRSWDLYRERMHRASRLVEDEIFLDIGLLDRHALMDVDQNELAKTLVLAIQRANKHIFEPKYGLLANLQTIVANEPLCQKTLNRCKKGLEDWAKVQVDQAKGIDWLLEHLRNYCHCLFDAKILLGSHAKMLLPKCLEFINELRAFISTLESSLQEIRSEHRAQWGHQWIVECHAMRCELECFEPKEETKQAFEPLTKKIQALIDQIPEHSKLQLADCQKELDQHLDEIELLAKDPKKEHPFIYIPGYLAFFDVGEGV